MFVVPSDDGLQVFASADDAAKRIEHIDAVGFASSFGEPFDDDGNLWSVAPLEPIQRRFLWWRITRGSRYRFVASQLRDPRRCAAVIDASTHVSPPDRAPTVRALADRLRVLPELTYALDGVGWSTCVIDDGRGRTELSASYLSDALGDLISAFASVAEGDVGATFVFANEPGEYRWSLRRSASLPSVLDVVITWFDDWDLFQDTPRQRPVLSASWPLPDAVAAVHRMASDLVTRVGTYGYRKQWLQHDFPSAGLERLGVALAHLKATSA